MGKRNKSNALISVNEFCMLCESGTPQQIKTAVEGGANVLKRLREASQ